MIKKKRKLSLYWITKNGCIRKRRKNAFWEINKCRQGLLIMNREHNHIFGILHERFLQQLHVSFEPSESVS